MTFILTVSGMELPTSKMGVLSGNSWRTGCASIRKHFIFLFHTGRLLGCVPYSRTNPVSTLGEGFELLGVKWVPSLSIQQAKVKLVFKTH